jgi:hypothetical protein
MTVCFEKAEEFSRVMICSLQSNGASMGPSDLLSQGNFLCRSAFLLPGSVGWGPRAFVFRLDGIGPIHASMELYAPNRHTRADSVRGIR